MTSLHDLVGRAVGDGGIPGAAALVAVADGVEVATAGELEADSIVRIASITKPITAAGVMLLVDEGRVSLDDPIERWLPELAAPNVVRTPDAPLDDVVPAARPIRVEDLLTFRAGWGFPSDFSLPAVVELFQRLPVFGPPPRQLVGLPCVLLLACEQLCAGGGPLLAAHDLVIGHRRLLSKSPFEDCTRAVCCRRPAMLRG